MKLFITALTLILCGCATPTAPTIKPGSCPVLPEKQDIKRINITPDSLEFPDGMPDVGAGFYVSADAMSGLLTYIKQLETVSDCR